MTRRADALIRFLHNPFTSSLTLTNQRVEKHARKAHQEGGMNWPLLTGKSVLREKERNMLAVFRHVEARQQVNPIGGEQVLIHKHEVWFERAQK